MFCSFHLGICTDHQTLERRRRERETRNHLLVLLLILRILCTLFQLPIFALGNGCATNSSLISTIKVLIFFSAANPLFFNHSGNFWVVSFRPSSLLPLSFPSLLILFPTKYQSQKPSNVNFKFDGVLIKLKFDELQQIRSMDLMGYQFRKGNGFHGRLSIHERMVIFGPSLLPFSFNI